MMMGNERATRGWLRYYFTAGVFEGLAALVFLLRIPAEQKFVWLFGYSVLRLGLVLALLLVVAGFAWLAWKSWRDSAWLQARLHLLEEYLPEYRWSLPLMLVLFGSAIFLPYWHLFNLSPLGGLPLRVSPFVFLLFTRTLQTLIVFLVLSLAVYPGRRTTGEPARALLINRQKILVILAAITITLVVASIMGDIMEYSFPNDRAAVRYNKKFNVDLEMTIPTFYNAFILLFSGFLLGLIAALKKNARDPYANHWFILAFIFSFMAMDETISLHEFLIKPLRETFNTGGFLYFAWVIAAVPLLAVLGVSYRSFFAYLPKTIRIEFLAAAALYVVSALGIEMVGGWYFERYGGNQIPYIVLTTVEETLEMVALLIFIHALLNYLYQNFPQIQLRIQDTRQTAGK